MPSCKEGTVGWMPVVGLLVAGLWSWSCARLPYTTAVIHQDPRVAVTLQREVKPSGYTQPTDVHPEELAAILRGFSIRQEQRLPLPWYAEEVPPKTLFREDELAALVFPVSQGLRTARPDERVHFQLFAPGMNPADSRDVTAGWMAVREPYLYLHIEYFHTEIPIRKVDNYYQNYPLIPPQPKRYLLFFEPGRFWTKDQGGIPVLEYRQFLKTAPTVPTRSLP